MCWNQTVSLNTFLFSIFVLILIIYNNAYTQYKIKELNNFWVYMFFLSFIFMQLIEYFIWRNIKSPYYNSLFSILATLLLLIQPVVSLMLLSNEKLKYNMLLVYLVLAIPFAVYRLTTKRMYSVVSPGGHLQWKFLTRHDVGYEVVLFWVWLFFFLFSFFYNKNYFAFGFGFIMLLISIWNYYQDNSVESMWCWVVNSIFLFYAFYLLVYLPFSQ
jgi:hypothetical protein